MVDEWKYAVVDLSNNITTISTKPALVKGCYINTALSAHTCPIQDNTTAVYTLAASSPAESIYEWPPTRFETSLIVDPNDSATGNITITYKDLRA